MAWREESIVSQRLEFVTLVSAEGANIRELCRRYRISAPTGYKWIERHRAGGAPALCFREQPGVGGMKSDQCAGASPSR